MNDCLNEAKHLLGNNRTDKAARDLMTTARRDSLAEDLASKKQFLSASYLTPDADKRKEFGRLFRENSKPKNN